MSKVQNLVSVSGGKDSTAMILLTIEREVKDVAYVFADTGNEHPEVYKYLDYLESELNIEIIRVKADFTRVMAGKRRFIETKWREHGVDESIIKNALTVLQPTGNPFLDLCMWKGRFPSTKAQFCTGELKTNPINSQVVMPMLKEFGKVRSWQGIRRAESFRRSKQKMHEKLDLNVWAYRPIIEWSAEEVFYLHAKHGIKPNPLYLQGMNRVGCMPCINCRKDELAEISNRFPEVIDRLREWEELVSKAAKQGSSTFFATFNGTSEASKIHYKTHGVDAAVEWSKTMRGGKQFDLFKQGEEMPSCSSNYGLCDAG